MVHHHTRRVPPTSSATMSYLADRPQSRPRVSPPSPSLSSPSPSYDRFVRVPDPQVVARSGASTPRSPSSLSQSSTPGPRTFSIAPLTPYAEKQAKVFQREPPSSPLMSSYAWWRLKRLAARPLPWAIIIVIGLITWWSAGASTDFDSEDVQSRLRELFPPEFTKDLQFFPASNHKIHVSFCRKACRARESV